MDCEHTLIKEKSGPHMVFDSQPDYVFSIIISVYKWASCPWPCGVFMTKTGMLMTSTVFSDPFQSTALGSCDDLSELIVMAIHHIPIIIYSRGM